MENRVSNVVVARKAQLANAKARIGAAESAIRDSELKLKEKNKEIAQLESRMELVKRRNQARKELAVVLQKLDDSKKKLVIMEGRSQRAEETVKSLLSQADDFECKYRETKKNYNDLVNELDHLGIN